MEDDLSTLDEDNRGQRGSRRGSRRWKGGAGRAKEIDEGEGQEKRHGGRAVRSRELSVIRMLLLLLLPLPHQGEAVHDGVVDGLSELELQRGGVDKLQCRIAIVVSVSEGEPLRSVRSPLGPLVS